jgi:hypothetical protein
MAASASAGTGYFSPTGEMTSTRSLHTATELASGSVLIAGGADASGALVSAELFRLSGSGSRLDEAVTVANPVVFA